jgi:hypothetical protein
MVVSFWLFVFNSGLRPACGTKLSDENILKPSLLKK